MAEIKNEKLFGTSLKHTLCLGYMNFSEHPMENKSKILNASKYLLFQIKNNK